MQALTCHRLGLFAERNRAAEDFLQVSPPLPTLRPPKARISLPLESALRVFAVTRACAYAHVSARALAFALSSPPAIPFLDPHPSLVPPRQAQRQLTASQWLPVSPMSYLATCPAAALTELACET